MKEKTKREDNTKITWFLSGRKQRNGFLADFVRMPGADFRYLTVPFDVADRVTIF
jgi:hypothetical protein